MYGLVGKLSYKNWLEVLAVLTVALERRSEKSEQALADWRAYQTRSVQEN
jgi:hypothetical protein